MRKYVPLLLFSVCSLVRAEAVGEAYPPERPLRYTPEHGAFVIRNGGEFFNRPLYGPHTAFRIDGGDKPEFALLNGATHDGVLRLGLQTEAGAKLLTDAQSVVTRYHEGTLIYAVRDPLLGDATLTITAVSAADAPRLLLRAEVSRPVAGLGLVAVFGGVGEPKRGSIRPPDENGGNSLLSQLALTAEGCRGNEAAVQGNGFRIAAAGGKEIVTGELSEPEWIRKGDARALGDLAKLLASAGEKGEVIVSRSVLDEPVYLSIARAGGEPAKTAKRAKGLAEAYAGAIAYRKGIAETIRVETPDAFINAVPGALCTAADACWQSPTIMHGAVSWRTPLLGWRGDYMNDALGWHDRAKAFFTHWAAKQNTSDDFPTQAVPDPKRELAENNGKMLHSNGSIPSRHYDMNLVFFDALLRHLLDTGDLDFARQMWPAIQRHLAWEKRCFDRDGLYEGYACIWASDALEYNGGGAAHATAYNEFQNRMAARLAKLLGEDATPYRREAERIHHAMESQLWVPAEGCYAEYKDVMGEKLLHRAAALWSVYHAIDSGVPDPFEAARCLHYVDTQIAHIPLRGAGLPAGNFYVLPESHWMPYVWSLNNVVLAENAHTALAYWQGGDAAEGFRLFKSNMLDAMYTGHTPGDVPNLSAFDPYRGESYTDFADPIGITARAFTEGLFGIRPDALASKAEGVVLIRPGFPRAWSRASIDTPDLSYRFSMEKQTESWSVDCRYGRPMRLELQLPARRDNIARVEVNGTPAEWKNVPQSVGYPYIEVESGKAAAHYQVKIEWKGSAPAMETQAEKKLAPGDAAFVPVHQGKMEWYAESYGPVPAPEKFTYLDVHSPVPNAEKLEPVDMHSAFNARVTDVFTNEYRSPRPETCSLQIPLHGLGDWTKPNRKYEVDDSGLRRAAGEGNLFTLPDGLKFQTPSAAGSRNIAFTSQWANYPREVTVPLTGTAAHAYFLLAGTTDAMQSQLVNAEITVTYGDGSTDHLPLRNPENWWPIDQDYRIDNYAFARAGGTPLRIRLKTGEAYNPTGADTSGGGFATVLDLALDPHKPLRSVTLHTHAYGIVAGLMGVTLERR